MQGILHLTFPYSRMTVWDSIKQRYDVAFIGATFAIVFGLAFIFFTMVVADWMFPSPYRTVDSGETVTGVIANVTSSDGN